MVIVKRQWIQSKTRDIQMTAVGLLQNYFFFQWEVSLFIFSKKSYCLKSSFWIFRTFCLRGLGTNFFVIQISNLYDFEDLHILKEVPSFNIIWCSVSRTSCMSPVWRLFTIEYSGDQWPVLDYQTVHLTDVQYNK